MNHRHLERFYRQNIHFKR